MLKFLGDSVPIVLLGFRPWTRRGLPSPDLLIFQPILLSVYPALLIPLLSVDVRKWYMKFCYNLASLTKGLSATVLRTQNSDRPVSKFDNTYRLAVRPFRNSHDVYPLILTCIVHVRERSSSSSSSGRSCILLRGFQRQIHRRPNDVSVAGNRAARTTIFARRKDSGQYSPPSDDAR